MIGAIRATLRAKHPKKHSTPVERPVPQWSQRFSVTSRVRSALGKNGARGGDAFSA